MAFLFSYPETAGPIGTAWPEERLLTHMLRSAATASPEPFKSLHGNHPVDLFQSQDAYELRTDAPGMSQEDIVVEVHEDMLKVAAVSKTNEPAAPAPTPTGTPTATTQDKPHATGAAATAAHQQQQQQQWKVLRRERSTFPSWTRAYLLPEDADVERISVKLDRGMLTVHVPRRQPPPKAKPRRIQVNTQ